MAIPLDTSLRFEVSAEERLADASLPPELRAIYTSIVTGKKVFFSEFGWKP